MCISNVKSGKKPITTDVPRVQMSGCTCAFPPGALSEVFCLSSFPWGLLLKKEELGLSIICVHSNSVAKQTIKKVGSERNG